MLNAGNKKLERADGFNIVKNIEMSCTMKDKTKQPLLKAILTKLAEEDP